VLTRRAGDDGRQEGGPRAVLSRLVAWKADWTGRAGRTWPSLCRGHRPKVTQTLPTAFRVVCSRRRSPWRHLRGRWPTAECFTPNSEQTCNARAG
jgi:hypothetical protein